MDAGGYNAFLRDNPGGSAGWPIGKEGIFLPDAVPMRLDARGDEGMNTLCPGKAIGGYWVSVTLAKKSSS